LTHLTFYSDHALVTCRLPITAGQAAVAERLVRGRRRVNRDVLCTALTASPLCRPVADDADVDELFAQYDNVLRDIADRLAPLHVICRPAARRASRRGLTPAAATHDVSVVVWNDTTAACTARPITPKTVVSGSTQLEVVFGRQ